MNLSPLIDAMTHWLMKTYKCHEVPQCSVPEFPDGDDIIYLTSQQIRISSCHDIIESDSNISASLRVAADIADTLDLFESRIRLTLHRFGIDEGDDLYVRDWPVFMVDETVFRERKFGYYGWVDLFCVPWRKTCKTDG